MPYVTVYFDPKKIEQQVIDQLKVRLQPLVAQAMSDESVRLRHPMSTEDITTKLEWIMVLQHAMHPTDVNVPPFEIYIQAGEQKGRSGDKIVELLAKAISELGLISQEYLGDGESGIFLTFHNSNGFGYIPRRVT